MYFLSLGVKLLKSANELVQLGRLGEFQQSNVVGVALGLVVRRVGDHFGHSEVLLCPHAAGPFMGAKSTEKETSHRWDIGTRAKLHTQVRWTSNRITSFPGSLSGPSPPQRETLGTRLQIVHSTDRATTAWGVGRWGGVISIYKPYRYVPSRRISFSSISSLK